MQKGKLYQLVIMVENGKTYVNGPLHDWNGIQKAIEEVRELYESHGIKHHVGYLEVSNRNEA